MPNEAVSFRTRILILAMACAAIAVTGYLMDRYPPSPTLSGQLVDETSVGTYENPRARARFEWMRLRSPRSGHIPSGIRQRELQFAGSLPKRLDKTGSWQPRGPINVGGRTRAMAIDVTDESMLFAGGVSGGIWRSTDGGASWAKMTQPGQLHSVTWIAQDPRDGNTNTWYAGTGEFRGNTASGEQSAFLGNGIYKSTDGGQSWQLLPSTTSDTPQSFDSLFDFVWKVVADPSNTTDAEIYAATFGAIWRSTDGGSSWGNPVLGGNTPFPNYTDVVVTSDGTVFAGLSSDGSPSGVWTSPDGSAGNWTNITPSGWPTNYERVVLAMNPSDENEIWALARAPANGPSGDQGSGAPINHILWQYDTSTDTWIDYSSYLPARGDCDLGGDGTCESGASGQTGDFNSQVNYNLTLAVHPNDGTLVYVGGRNLWRIDTGASPTDGNTWIGGYTPSNNSAEWYAPTGSDRHHPDQHVITFLPSDANVMYVGSDGGIHRTDDNRAGRSGTAGDGAVTWTSVNDGYYTTQFYSVCLNADASDPVIAGGIQDNGTWSTNSSAPGVAWTQEAGGDGGHCAIANAAGADGTHRYVSSQSGTLRRLFYDNGGTLQDVTRIDPSGASGQLFMNPFALDPASPTLMLYPAGSSLWRTGNAETATPSRGWTEMTGIASSTTATITALDVSTSNAAHVLYYGTSDGNIYRLDDVDTAAPSASPVNVTKNLPQSDASANAPYVSSITVDPTDADNILVTFSNYEVESILYTTDGGATWTDVEGNLSGPDGPSVRWGAILPQPGLDQTTYYVATSVGVYATATLSGSGTLWTQEGPSSIGDVVVEQVRARPADGLVLIGTHANGVYSRDEPLPIELTTFSAVASEGSIQLKWETASETDNAGFEVQHKRRDAARWTAQAYISGSGTTNAPRAYRHRIDVLQPGRHQFRLKQVNADGSFNLSTVVEATLPLTDSFTLTAPYPNPVRVQSRLDLRVRIPQRVEAALYNSVGQKVQDLFTGQVPAHATQPLVVKSAGLVSGSYMVRVKGETFSAIRKLTHVR